MLLNSMHLLMLDVLHWLKQSYMFEISLGLSRWKKASMLNLFRKKEKVKLTWTCRKMRTIRWPTSELISMDYFANASANNLTTLGIFELSCPIITGLFLRTKNINLYWKNFLRFHQHTIQSNHINNHKHKVFLQYLH